MGLEPMKIVILDPTERKRLIKRRRETGADRFDEVWDGVYVMSPIGDNLHQYLSGKLVSALDQSFGATESIKVFPAVNISDREEKWKRNFRCPDVAIFSARNPAKDRGNHWLGGPDFAVEILSPHDRSRRKLQFYAKVGVRELLLIDRDPWCLEPYRLRGAALEPAGKTDLAVPSTLSSTVLPLTFRLLPSEPRPLIELARADTGQHWTV